MKALEAQRQKPVDAAGSASTGSQGGGQQAAGPLTAAQKREQQLEERRRKFFDKSATESRDASDNNYNGFGSAAEQPAIAFQAPVARELPKPKAVEAEIRPSDWKSKGFPSEYAYMKAAGQLNVPSKPAVEIVPVSSSSNNPYPQRGSDQQVQRGADQRGGVPSSSAMVGGGVLNIGSVAEKDSKRQKQSDYARGLNQQTSSHPQAETNNQQFGSHFLTYNSNNPMNGGGGLNIGAIDDKDAKRQKQAEYARALDQQAIPHPHPSEGHFHAHQNGGSRTAATNQYGGGGGLNIGGAADDKDAKRQKQAEYARALDHQSYAQPSADSHHQSKALSKHNANVAAANGGNGGGGLNIGGAVDDKDLKRQKQAEYARALDQQAHFQSQVELHHNRDQVPRNYAAQNPGTNLVGGGGLNFGAVDDKETKRQKQAEYARALDQQATMGQGQHVAKQSNFTPYNEQNPTNGGGGGGLNIGGAVDDKDLKRQKQAEYARALDQQAYAQPAAFHQASRMPAQNHLMDPTIGGGGLNIGAVDDKDAKRQKQAEYARALGQQQQSDAWAAGGRGGEGGGGGAFHSEGLGLAGLGGPGPQAAAYAKKQQQQEYTNQLNQAQYQQQGKLNKFGEYDQPAGRGQQHQAHSDRAGLLGLGGLQGKDALNAKRQQQQDYTNQLNAQAQQQQPAKLNKFGEYEQPGRHHAQQQAPTAARLTDINNIGGGDDGRMDKRAKQAEYNMALQQQQYLQNLQQQQSGNSKHAEQRAASAVATGFKPSGGLEEGWVIGPMGLPVRKTLEVGNRGVQRAYANHIAETQSPTKAHVSSGNVDHGQGRGFDMDSYQQAAHMLNSPPRYGGAPPGGMGLGYNGAPVGGGYHGGGPATALGGDIGGNPDDRAMKVKMQQAEQARVLEMQMRANQERKDAEKKQRAEEDAKELHRMEMQRIAIQQELEREAQEKKMKIDEDNRKELERQMQAKRMEKEREAEREKERAEKEDEKVREEAERIRRRQELEMQQEAAAAQRQEQQRQQALELEKRQSHLQTEALHRKHLPAVHQVPMEYFEPAPELRREEHGGGPPGSRGGPRGNSHLFDRPDLNQVEIRAEVHPISRNGARERSNLFDRAPSDDIFAPAAVRTDYEHHHHHDMQLSPAPMSPNKRHVDRVLADRVHNERFEIQAAGGSRGHTEHHVSEPLEHQQTQSFGHQPPRHLQEAFEEKKAATPPILNLNNLKRNISEGAVVSGRRSARGGAGRDGSRAGTAPKASPHDPYHPEREREEAEAEDSFSPLPMHRPPSRSFGAAKQNPHRTSGSRMEVNQYVPASQMHAHQASGGRLDKTLEFESKFLLPDGTFMQSNSKPSTPLRTARWSRLGAADVGHSSDNRCNSRGSSSAMAEMISPGKSPADSPQRSISSPASGPTRSLIDEFKDTLHLLQEPRAALAQSMSQQRPSTSGSTNSDFDLEKFNRRNARKWQVLQNMKGDKDSPDEDLLFRAVGDVHSRPTTSGSIGSSSSGYRPRLFDPYPEEKGYHYGARAEPSSAFHPVRGGGIAAGTSTDLSSGARPNSAELARKLSRLNSNDVPRAREPPRGYVSRPLSGKRDVTGGDAFSIGQRAEMNLQAPSGVGSYRSRNRYANVAASVEDQDFDNYSDYGL